MRKQLLVVIVCFFSLTTFANKERWDENKKDWSPLMLAIYNGQTPKFNQLIESGVDINYVTPGKNSNWRLTALEVAIRKDNETAVNALLKTNRIYKPETFLMPACGQKSVSNVNHLIKYGASPCDTLENGYSVLMMAASFGSYEIMETLLKQGADTKQTRKVDGMTALMLAAFNGQIKKVKLLLNYGADKSILDKNGHAALYHADNIYDRFNVSDEIKKELKEMLR